MIALFLLTFLQALSSVHAAECDPKIAEGAAAMAHAEHTRNIQLEWDRLTYEIANYNVLGPEIVPIQLGQLVMTPDGTTGWVQRIENARNIAVLDRETADNRYVIVDLQKIHPVEHGAKPLKRGGMVWFKVEGKPKSGRVEDIIESDSTAVVIAQDGSREKIPLQLLAKDISGAKRIHHSSMLPSLTGRNSILDMQNIHSFLNDRAFMTQNGIDHLKEGLLFYGLSTKDSRDLKSLEYFLTLDLEKSDPENSLVKFCVLANQQRVKSGLKPIEVNFAKTVEDLEVSVVSIADQTILETFKVKSLEDFVRPDYFDERFHKIEHEAFIVHAHFDPNDTSITLSHKNLLYILLEGRLGQSLHHEFGHGNSVAFEDSFDRVWVESKVPFLAGYPNMILDENRQHLRNLRGRLIEAIKNRSVTIYRLKEAKKILNSIRRTAYLNRILLDAVVDGGKDASWILDRTIQHKIGDELSAVFTLPDGTLASFPVTKLKGFYSKKFLRLFKALPPEGQALLAKAQNQLFLSSSQQLALYSTAMDASSQRKVRDYISEHTRIAQLAKESIEATLLEMNWVYQPMIEPALKAKAKMDYLLRDFSILSREEKHLIMKEEILPNILSVWKNFTQHRAEQSNRFAPERARARASQRSTSPAH